MDSFEEVLNDNSWMKNHLELFGKLFIQLKTMEANIPENLQLNLSELKNKSNYSTNDKHKLNEICLFLTKSLTNTQKFLSHLPLPNPLPTLLPQTDLKTLLWPESYSISDFSLNIFEFSTQPLRCSVLELFSYEILNFWNLFTSLKIDTLKFSNFSSAISHGYKKIPYHNSLHAADVLQGCHIVLSAPESRLQLDFTPFHKAILFISAIIHDFKHPGVRNSYLSAASHKLAVRYNDISILENYHLAQAFKILQDPNYNILEQIENGKAMKERIVQCVLDTDMAYHNKHLAQIRECVRSKPEFGLEWYLSMILHAADLSNLCRDFRITEQWGYRIREEMIEQTRLEEINGVEISYRRDLSAAHHQYGFIQYITPYFEALADVDIVFCDWLKAFKENEESWKRDIESQSKLLADEINN